MAFSVEFFPPEKPRPKAMKEVESWKRKQPDLYNSAYDHTHNIMPLGPTKWDPTDIAPLKGVPGVYECKLGGNGVIGRIYFIQDKEVFYILHAHIKKSPKDGKIPKIDREMINKNLKQFKEWRNTAK